MRAFTFYLLSTICFFGILISNVSAQTQNLLTPNGGAAGVPQLEEQVSYTLLPARPKEGDIVEIEAQMFGTPVKNAVFTWYINGKLYKKEQGLNRISVSINKNTKVNLLIVTVTGTQVTKEWVFNPQNVILIWEANTYTPPFYKGKSLYTAESALTFHGINLDVKNPLTNKYANYIWKTDGVVQGSNSGVSKNSFTYQSDLLQYEPLFELLYSNVTNFDQVKAGASSAPISTRAIKRVQTLESSIFTYEKTPLLGVLFNKKIDTVLPVSKPEVSLVTYPVYYSVASSLTPEYTWLLNDTVIRRGSNVLSFKKTKNDVQSRLTISISYAKSLLQSGSVSHIIDTTSKTKEGITKGFGQ